MERRALGKGINALIPDTHSQDTKREEVIYASLDKIRPNALQPREVFDQVGIEELAASIKEKGVIQPLVVRRQGDNFELIAGERRFRAAQTLDMKEIPVLIKNVDDRESLELALIENIQRENLNSIEEARAYQYLLDKFQVTQERMSEVLGKARTTITNTLRLLKLPQEVQDEIKKSRISYGHGRALLEIEDANQQRHLTKEIIARGLSVREIENIIKTYRNRTRRRVAGVQKQQDPYIAVKQEVLQHALGTKVRITRQKKRGSIVIDFYSQDDLERIVSFIAQARTPV
jgi:ParB family transcriptional regulator, chromosome partitioning protein